MRLTDVLKLGTLRLYSAPFMVYSFKILHINVLVSGFRLEPSYQSTSFYQWLYYLGDASNKWEVVNQYHLQMVPSTPF